MDTASERLVRVLLHDADSSYRPVGLLDDAPESRGLRLEGCACSAAGSRSASPSGPPGRAPSSSR
ncbi:hypothetical protein V2I01_35980 [Micromonospora sp. BRA006-A]|nr:hypothetical protein [Micromonospora sp. BRA006-A]